MRTGLAAGFTLLLAVQAAPATAQTVTPEQAAEAAVIARQIGVRQLLLYDAIASGRVQPASPEAMAAYFRDGAAATSVPQNSAYFTHGAEATTIPADTASGRAYFTNGTAVTGKPLDVAGNPYFSNGAAVTTIPPNSPYYVNGAAPLVAPALVAPAPASVPAAAPPEAPAEAAPPLETTSATFTLAQPLVHEDLEEEEPTSEAPVEEEERAERWLETAAPYAPRLVTARVAHTGIQGIPVRNDAGWAALVSGGAIAAVVAASARRRRRTRAT